MHHIEEPQNYETKKPDVKVYMLGLECSSMQRPSIRKALDSISKHCMCACTHENKWVATRNRLLFAFQSRDSLGTTVDGVALCFSYNDDTLID